MILIEKSFYDSILKSGPINRSHLIKTQKTIIRNGKAIRTYVYINPDNQKINTQNTNLNDNFFKVKSGLKTTETIADYMTEKLKTIGYEIEEDFSGLSDSRYITITNYSELTGRESKYNEDSLKIRISGHDLPPSYDGLHGYHDIDINSSEKKRGGNDGGATYYDVVLNNLYQLLKPEIKEKLKKQKKEIIEINKKNKSQLPLWANSIETIKEKKETVNSIDARLFLSSLINGGAFSKNKKPTESQRNQRIIDFMNDIKNRDENVKKLYSELFEMPKDSFNKNSNDIRKSL